ncbi:hypothetical protein C0Q70_15060 [Pomacea canaliculata]|uniref:Uncharacterized protein n=1 Tax=Pomacea canaliculata TaxID=400727 RepID=A0A2T7NTS3_POMCA|nr:hypothetical protein C0Q70_15060 [Pomacea canaliculata]
MFFAASPTDLSLELTGRLLQSPCFPSVQCPVLRYQAIHELTAATACNADVAIFTHTSSTAGCRAKCIFIFTGRLLQSPCFPSVQCPVLRYQAIHELTAATACNADVAIFTHTSSTAGCRVSKRKDAEHLTVTEGGEEVEGRGRRHGEGVIKRRSSTSIPCSPREQKMTVARAAGAALRPPPPGNGARLLQHSLSRILSLHPHCLRIPLL